MLLSHSLSLHLYWQPSNYAAIVAVCGSSNCLAVAILRHIVCLFRFGSKYKRNNNNNKNNNSSSQHGSLKLAHKPLRNQAEWPLLLMISLVFCQPPLLLLLCHKIIIIARYCAIDLSFNAEFISRASEWVSQKWMNAVELIMPRITVNCKLNATN